MKKKKYNNIIEYMLLLLVILLSKTVFWGVFHEYETTILLSIVTLLNVCLVGRLQVNKSNIRAFALLTILIINNILIHYESISENLVLFNCKRIYYCLVSMIIATTIDRAAYVVKYVRIMFVISLISFFFLGLKIFRPWIIYRVSTRTINPTYVYNPFYTFWRLIPYENRNYGPFWEPGGFQGFLIIALVLFVFNNEFFKYRKIIFTVLVMAIISTFSTTGYIALILVIIAGWKEILHIIIKEDDKKINKIALFLMIVGAAVLTIKYMLTVKVISDKLFTHNSSIIERMNDLQAGLKMILTHPITGYGSYNLAKSDIIKYGGSLAFSNGFLSLGFTFGIPFLIVYLYFFKRGIDSIVKSDSSSVMSIVIVYMLFIVQFFGEEVCALPLYWGFIFQHDLKFLSDR